MKNCSLFLPVDQPEQLAAAIKAAFPGFDIDFNSAPDVWTQAKVSKKAGWFSRPTLTIQLLSFRQPNEFVPMMQGMMNFVGQVPAQNQPVQFKLMTKIQNTKSALGMNASSGFDLFEDGIFQIAQALDGFAFTDGAYWVNGNRQVILSTSGQSEVTDLNVPDAAVQLGQADAASDDLFPSQVDRKNRSIAFLKSRNVPVIDHLPCIEADEEVQIPSKEAVVQRTLAVAIAAVKAEGLDDAMLQQVIAQFGVKPFFSREEAQFIGHANPDDQQRTKFSWRYECLWVFLWALGFVEELDYPDQVCDVSKAVGFIRDAGNYQQLLSGSTLRPAAQILDAADLIYRMNWACVSARIKQQPAPAGLEAGVVYERHYALNWLIGYQGLEWDDMRADT